MLGSGDNRVEPRVKRETDELHKRYRGKKETDDEERRGKQNPDSRENVESFFTALRGHNKIDSNFQNPTLK
jgi:hypothetical protein